SNASPSPRAVRVSSSSSVGWTSPAGGAGFDGRASESSGGRSSATSISRFDVRSNRPFGFTTLDLPRSAPKSALCSGGSAPTERNSMATLAYQHEEIAPRELKPSLYELDGISRASVEAHYKLYQGYVNKRNEILAKLAEVDLSAANQIYSEVRALKVDLSFAIGGIKNHELYFEHLGGHGGDPDGPIG